jgi:hypothetical protein
VERSAPAGSDLTDDLASALRLRLAANAPAQHRNCAGRLARAFAADLESVRSASEALSAGERRVNEIEARSAALADRAVQQLEQVHARIRTAEEAERVADARTRDADERARLADALTRDAEERVQSAEARLLEAEHWLKRLHDAIQDHLVVRRNASGDTAAA